MKRRPLILAGLAGWILWLPMFILLCVTIVGIPVAILLIFLTPVLVLLGYVAAGFVVGEKGLRLFGDGGLYKRMFTGLLFLEGALLLRITKATGMATPIWMRSK